MDNVQTLHAFSLADDDGKLRAAVPAFPLMCICERQSGGTLGGEKTKRHFFFVTFARRLYSKQQLHRVRKAVNPTINVV